MATFAPIHSSKSSAAKQAALHVMDWKKKKKAASGSPAARDSESEFKVLASAWQKRAEC